MFLERLERADFDPFAAGLQKRMWTLPWRAWRAYAKKEF